MITAEEARKITEQAQSDEKYITDVIGDIEERIKESAESGLYYTKFELDLTKRSLNDAQKQKIFDYLSCNGFNSDCFVMVQGKYEQTMSLTISWSWEKK